MLSSKAPNCRLFQDTGQLLGCSVEALGLLATRPCRKPDLGFGLTEKAHQEEDVLRGPNVYGAYGAIDDMLCSL